MPFFIIFVLIPILEIAVFMKVGAQIGLSTTLMMALLTAVIGGLLVRRQGLETLIAIRFSLEHGKVPLGEIFDGLCLVAAGAMLITPGFVTDTLGFLLLVPPVRAGLRKIIQNHTNWAIEKVYMEGGQTLEGDFQEVREDEDKP